MIYDRYLAGFEPLFGGVLYLTTLVKSGLRGWRKLTGWICGEKRKAFSVVIVIETLVISARPSDY